MVVYAILVYPYIHGEYRYVHHNIPQNGSKSGSWGRQLAHQILRSSPDFGSGWGLGGGQLPR